MRIGHRELRTLFKDFWKQRDHKEVPAIPLVPKDDPTTLFTGSGMQQLVPYLLGEPHPLGERIFNIQPCFRAQDIEEIGDNRHTTSFEMMGNWSFGNYFKKEQIAWFWEFLTSREYLGLSKEKLHVTVFKGFKKIPKDDEAIAVWKSLGLQDDHIHEYDAKKNWWSRAGIPDNMPTGEPGGPDSEVFYDFGAELKLHENSAWKDEECHVNCDCGRYLEIGNSVFMQYKKNEDGTFSELPKKNVDFGGGLERLLAAKNNDPDVFKIDIFVPVIKTIEYLTDKKYEDINFQSNIRIIVDHVKAAVFVIKDGVSPSNKEQGYVLRRLLRRAAIKFKNLKGELKSEEFASISEAVLHTYDGVQGIDKAKQKEIIFKTIKEEVDRFGKSLDRGLKEIQKLEHIDGRVAFDLYQSYGFPLEITEELLREKGRQVDKDEFKAEFEKHKNLSRTSSAGMFKGGLADHSNQVLKYHTATHLLHQALFDVLGDEVRQEGSNITGERLRFDFTSSHRPTEDEVKKIEDVINKKVAAQMNVDFKIMPKEEAEQVEAKSFFKEKYPDMVKVYYIGESLLTAYSKEFCGGPHVKNTKEIGKISVYKVEKIGSNLFRIYAK